MSTRNGVLAFAVAGLGMMPLTTIAALTQWPVNNHYYESVVADGIAWPAANTAATSIVNFDDRGLQCYLATLTSAAEDQFVDSVRDGTPGINTSGQFPNSELWVGGFQSPGTAQPAASWFWVNNEGAFSFTNWLPNEPNDAGGDERYLTVGWSNLAGWNDEASLDGIFGYVRECQVAVDAQDDGPVEATSGVAKNVNVVANDTIASGSFTVTIEDSPDFAGNTAVVRPDNTIDYTSDSAFEGTDTFKYRVTHANGAYAVATVTMTVAAETAVVSPGTNQLIFNQAIDPAPNSNNPLSAAYSEVLPSARSNEVDISCCLVLDEREGAARRGKYLPTNFDLGLAMGRTGLNPTCVGMPPLGPGQAVLRPWQRGVPESKGTNRTNPPFAREHDLGVCVIDADVASRGVVFSAEEARNVMGYSLNGRVKTLNYRPFTGGVSIDPPETDNPYVVPWTAEWDESRSGKRYSTNVMVVNLWHEWLLLPSVPYLLQLASSLEDSINQVNMSCPMANTDGFLNDLKSRVRSAQWNMLVAILPWLRTSAGNQAVSILDDATRLAMLIGDDADDYDNPYASCPDNPEGLFVGRMMSLKFASCSELVHPFSSASTLDGNCKIADDILCELPELPGFPHPASCSP